uniref:M1 family aminopeptidase n=1 Tax=Lygus hesperus TaxID=30085 RepID=A0A0A9Z5U0_LYGHE
MLEGLYFDYTPELCPQTIITQCQQYGFQRITPSIDQMLNKQVYTTTIIADGSYTNMITNGDLVPPYCQTIQGSLPRPKYQPPSLDQYNRYGDVEDTVAKGRRVLRYSNCTVPMATYLFFLGVGTYVTFYRTVEYPDGDTFQIELLVFPSITPPHSCIDKLDSIF